MQVPVPQTVDGTVPNGGFAEGTVLIDPATGLPYKAGTGSGSGYAVTYQTYKATATATGYNTGDLIQQTDEWNISSSPATWTSTTWRNLTQNTALSGAPASANIVPVSATATSVTVSSSALPTGAAQDGVDGTGITPPTGGSGIRGWLSGIFAKLPSSLGAKTTANSLSICLPSDQGPLLPNVITTGSLTAASGAGSTVTTTAGGILNAVGIALDFTTGSGVGTVVFEKSVDGMNWDAVSVLQFGVGNTFVSSATATGRFQTGDGAIQQFRVRCSAFTSGTIGVTLVATQGLGTLSVSQATAANLNATVVNSNPATPVTFQVKIATTGLAQALPSNTFVNGFVVKAKAASVSGAGNVANVFVGGASVNTTDDGTGTGYRLSPGEANSYALPNSNQLYIIGTAGDVVYVQGN